MICHDDQRRAVRDDFPILEPITRAKQMCATQKAEVQIIDTFFVRLIAKNIQANPLNWVKNHKTHAKEQIINDRYRVRNNFLHRKKMSAKITKLILANSLKFYEMLRKTRRLQESKKLIFVCL